jgi:isopentenyl-diphosphate Delta-isomerase
MADASSEREDPSPESVATTVSRRKAEHLDTSLRLGDGHDGVAGWQDLHLVHQAVPRVDLDDVDLGTTLLGRQLRLPVVIAGMTGGTPAARDLNATLGRVAEMAGLAVGVGSQRAALRDPSLASTYSVVREHAPSALVIANIGASQLIDQPGEPGLSRADVRAAIEMVDADALAVHLNFVEELVQPEGQRRAAGLVEALEQLCAWCPVPVVAKETGSGLSAEAAEVLRGAGVQALDVGGLGGTSFRAIEQDRAESQGDLRHVHMGQALTGWGIPTPVSVVAARGNVPVVATGGLRTGVDAAKALALGARAVGIGRPILEQAMQGEAAALAWLSGFEEQLRAATFLAGCSTVNELQLARCVVSGETQSWLRQLELHP